MTRTPPGDLSSLAQQRLEAGLPALRAAVRRRAVSRRTRTTVLAFAAGLAALAGAAWFLRPAPTVVGPLSIAPAPAVIPPATPVRVAEISDDELERWLAEAGRPGLIRVGERVYTPGDFEPPAAE